MRRSNKRKLLAYQVQLIRQMRRERFPEKFILNLFGISRSAYYHATHNGSYKEIR